MNVSASATARGVGRSTIPVNIEARGRGEVESDIAQRVADINLKNELQRRAEMQYSQGQLGTLGGQAASIRQNRAMFDVGNFRDFGNRQDAYGDAKRAGLMSGVNSVASMALGGIGAAQGAQALSIKQQEMDILNDVLRNKARVNVGSEY